GLAATTVNEIVAGAHSEVPLTPALSRRERELAIGSFDASCMSTGANGHCDRLAPLATLEEKVGSDIDAVLALFNKDPAGVPPVEGGVVDAGRDLALLA